MTSGAYISTHAATVPDLAAAMLPGPYPRAGLSARSGHIASPTRRRAGPIARRAGYREHSFVRERLLDAIADGARAWTRVEVRRRNSARTGSAMPLRDAGSTRSAHEVVLRLRRLRAGLLD